MNVLIAVDGTESAWDAVRFAAGFLSSTDEVAVINVTSALEPAVIPAGGLGAYASTGYAIPAALRDPAGDDERSHGVAEAMAHDAAAALGTTETVVETGGVVDRICTIAEQSGVDLIVVGTRDPGLFDRIMTGGSISREIVDRAPCSVLVVR